VSADRVGNVGEKHGQYEVVGGEHSPLSSPPAAKTLIEIRCACGQRNRVLLTHWKHQPPKSCAKCSRKKSAFNKGWP